MRGMKCVNCGKEDAVFSVDEYDGTNEYWAYCVFCSEEYTQGKWNEMTEVWVLRKALEGNECRCDIIDDMVVTDGRGMGILSMMDETVMSDKYGEGVIKYRGEFGVWRGFRLVLTSPWVGERYDGS
jgi:hypothetical protein